MSLFATISRYLVGALFIFSGLIKLNDPVGTAIKFEEYFEVFAVDFGNFFHLLVPMALFFSVAFSILEVVLGLAVLLKYRMQITAWALLLLILFFTFLTFYSAYFNKVTDCGCFGDAIKLTPWESFNKDLILVVLIGAIFFIRNRFVSTFDNLRGDLIVGGTLIVCLVVGIIAVEHLPYIDFRAYAVGESIPRNLLPQEDPIFEYTFKKNNQVIKSHTYLSENDGYTYIDYKILNQDKAQAKITDYNIWNDEKDITQESLEGLKLFVVMHDAKKTHTESLKNIKTLIESLGNNGVEPLIVTASDGPTFEQFRHEWQLAVPYYYGDATVLKTIIRSNSGLVLLQDGNVIGKWHYNDVPNVAEINQLIQSKVL